MAGRRLLIDQGAADEFLAAGQLRPDDFVAAARAAGVEVDYRLQAGYDHSYYFVASFIGEHIAFHAQQLRRP
jgi:S-formylglutathione hydrolase